MKSRQNPKPNGLACVTCGARLHGKQKRFCSQICANKHWGEVRKAGEAGLWMDPDPIINAFLADFKALLERHKDAVNSLATRKKYG